MANHNDLGKEGEDLALAWLIDHGFEILFRNWRHSRFEIDIIAKKNDMLHFVEVKSRTSNHYGFPESGVNKKKIRSVFQAVDEFLYLNPSYRDFRIDIISITKPNNGPTEYLLIEDVYL